MSTEPHRIVPLGIDDLASVLNDTFPCRAKWYNLGVQLRVDVSKLNCFKEEYTDPRDKLREVLITWLTTTKNPTWGAMIDALKSPVIEEAQLVRKLQQKYCSSGQPPVDANQALANSGSGAGPDLESEPSTIPQGAHMSSTVARRGKRTQRNRRAPIAIKKLKLSNICGGQLTPPLEAVPPPHTPPIPLIQSSIEGTNAPELSPNEVDLPSQAPTTHLEGTPAQPLSLKEEIEQFEEKFEDLVDHVLNAFKTGGVSIRRVLKCLRQLPVSLKLHFGEFLQSQAARLSRVSNIDELFFILSPRWDFLNPSLLTHLACRFGDEQTIRSVDKYLGELREFRMRTKINNFIDKWTGILPPDTQEIVMELGDNWMEQSLEKLEVFRIEVSRKRCFEDYVMPLKRIKVSCVDAIFSLPESVDIASLDLESLWEFFQEHQVLRILLNGECIFNLQLQQEPQETALMVAARKGNVGIVTKLILHGCNVNLTNKDGRTALHLAEQEGHEDVVDLLLEAKADPEVKDKGGDTALMVASSRGHSSVVRKLLQAGATVNTTREDGWTALHIAAQEGYEKVAELLLEANVDPELKIKGGGTALMVASFKGHSSVVRKLLQAGATVYTTEENGWTALHLAAQEGHKVVVELLLEANANLELKNKNGDTALMVASFKGHSSVVRKLLQAGATVNTAREDGCTALHVAAQNGYEDVVVLLLEANADPDLKRKGGDTALMVASFKGHSSVVRKLLQAGAAVNSTKEDGCTALHLAAHKGHEDVVELLEANTDLELKYKGGGTALMVASLKGHSSVVRKLLQAGANVNTTVKDGWTALHNAAQEGHEDVVELLLEAKADPELKNKDGATALMVASSNGHYSVMLKLHQAGATIGRREGTSLFAAREVGHEDYFLWQRQTQTQNTREGTSLFAAREDYFLGQRQTQTQNTREGTSLFAAREDYFFRQRQTQTQNTAEFTGLA